MVDEVMFKSEKNDWGTPQWLFDQLDAEFDFNLDPAASEENAKCSAYITIEGDGLYRGWMVKRFDYEAMSEPDSPPVVVEEVKGRVFVNPPYGRGETGKWVKKAVEEIEKGYAEIVVMLLPARTDTQWFHDYIYGKAEIRFLRGRLKFEGAEHSAPFPSMIVIFRQEDFLSV